jgi:hypothetical protein
MMQVLVYLAERPGAMVSRRELFDVVWATEFVSDNALTHAVAEIRKSLGDNARTPTYIETVQRRGYRLIAPVRGLEPGGHGRRQVACWLISGAATFPLHAGETVIGRDMDADIRIESPKVSRHHARITVEEPRRARGSRERQRHVGQRRPDRLAAGAAARRRHPDRAPRPGLPVRVQQPRRRDRGKYRLAVVARLG